MAPREVRRTQRRAHAPKNELIPATGLTPWIAPVFSSRVIRQIIEDACCPVLVLKPELRPRAQAWEESHA